MKIDEIKKALKCCCLPKDCTNCPYCDADDNLQCFDILKRDVFNLIVCQKAEIERLKERDETAEKIIREQGGTILHLKNENSRLFDRNFELSEKGEKAVIACIAARAEAVKECLNWVLSLFPEDKNFTTISRFTVKQKLKEMVGDTEC
jgi:hypothetical protein